MKPIVVGVDGSVEAVKAVRWAATEARIRHRPLHIAHCWFLIDVLRDPGIDDPKVRAACQRRADHVLQTAVDVAVSREPSIVVTSTVVAQVPSWGLLSIADDAEMLVVGARGLGAFAQLLLGSTSHEIAARASCPVVVVRGADDPHERIVVGVDGSERSLGALEFAFDEAAWRHASVVAVHGCNSPHYLADFGPTLREHIAWMDAEDHRRVKESLAGFAERYPEVRVEERFVHESGTQALVCESATADLVVVGSRGHSSTTGLLLGSVAHAVLRHADCAVAVVHAPTSTS